jgi:hypothetical protein
MDWSYPARTPFPANRRLKRHLGERPRRQIPEGDRSPAPNGNQPSRFTPTRCSPGTTSEHLRAGRNETTARVAKGSFQRRSQMSVP